VSEAAELAPTVVAPRWGALAWPAALLLAVVAIPFVAGDYWTAIATRAAVYWVLVAGLNLVVGFAGQLAIGYVALLTLGAYAAAALAEKAGVPAPVGVLAAGAVGALGGVLVGLPALRLRTFYFAMSTLGFATIVTQVALAWTDVMGGGVGLPGPAFAPPFDGTKGFYALCMAVAAVVTVFSANLGFSRFGRALVALRDAEVAAEASGVRKAPLLMSVFLFSGACAGVAGALFASLQSYITPDAFTFDLSVLFFTAILIGGRGAVIGPLLATALLTVLPEFAAPLVAWSTFVYAALLLLVVLLAPGGIAQLLDRAGRKPLHTDRHVTPCVGLLPALLERRHAGGILSLRGVELRFGAVRAIDGLDLDLKPGEVHGLIGPNGSGKTTTLNVISGFGVPQAGSIRVGNTVLGPGAADRRATAGIARTFQTPRLAGEASVLDNVLLGCTAGARSTVFGAMLTLPGARREEATMRERAMQALRAVGLERLAAVRADRLQHSELRFVEIARALVARPDFLLLDEPAAGLSPDEIERLGGLVRAVASAGVGVLLVEHHADLIFAVCDRVTVLNLGRILAAGTPAEVQADREVVEAYLGG
jgi:branched-chain amino acid transport system permease protein